MKTRDYNLEWTNTTQGNKNGSSSGEFNFLKDRWEATVNLTKPDETGQYTFKVYKTFKKHSKSHRKVAIWLKKMRLKYNLND